MKIINKKGFAPRDFLLGLVFFCAVAATVFVMATSMGNNYGVVTINEQFNQRYNKLNDMMSISNSMMTNVSSGSGLQLVGTFTSLFSATFKVIILTFQSINIATEMVLNSMLDLNVPTEISTIITGTVITFIIIGITMAVVSLLSRGRI